MLVGFSSIPGKGCPSQEGLQAYIGGKLPFRLLDGVANHAAACSACQSSLEEVAPETANTDPLIDKLHRCVALTDERPTDDAERITELQGGLNRCGLKALEIRNGTAAAVQRLPRVFSQYELLEEVGHGGMGVVYKARQLRLNRIVAIKVIRSGTYGSSGERARFSVESEAVARLRHPHVIQVHEFNENNGQLYLCMEYLEGGTLDEKIAGKGLPLRTAAQLVQTLAGAVHAAHQQHIVHRDLKPANVLLAADGTPKISDFGLAKLLDAQGSETVSEAILGTPSYMAPEQAEGPAKNVGPLADVYALGAILYHALAGVPPFKGASRMATLDLIRTREAVLPTRVRRDIPRDLEAICLKCLAKRPGQRYASAEALAQDLGRWLNGEPTIARPSSWYARAWRRTPRGALTATLLVLGSFASFFLFLDPDRPLRAMEAQLASNQKVTVIGESGKPPWTDARPKAPLQTLDDKDVFTVDTWSLALLELVRDPQVDHYRIYAEVRHNRGDVCGEVGLFVGLKEYNAGAEKVFFFVRAAFDDTKDLAQPFQQLPPDHPRPMDLPKMNPVYLGPHLLAVGWENKVWDAKVKGHTPLLFKAAGKSGGSWRQLTLEVTPAGVRGTWAGNVLIGELTTEWIETNSGETLAIAAVNKPDGLFLKGIKPEFRSRSPLGFYVHKSSASFRRVVIEPVVPNIQHP